LMDAYCSQTHKPQHSLSWWLWRKDFVAYIEPGLLLPHDWFAVPLEPAIIWSISYYSFFQPLIHKFATSIHKSDDATVTAWNSYDGHAMWTAHVLRGAKSKNSHRKDIFSCGFNHPIPSH
jgi:hypothetical protein